MMSFEKAKRIAEAINTGDGRNYGKFVTAQEMEERIRPEGPLRFYRLDGADNEITFTFPSGGQMMSLNIGFNVFDIWFKKPRYE